MEERRAVVRTRVRRNAELVIDQRTVERVPCTLRDLTSVGACIALASTDRVPDTFELTLDHGRSLRLCRVRWRADDRLGVSFEKSADDSKATGVT
jgi:hypothetical protein